MINREALIDALMDTALGSLLDDAHEVGEPKTEADFSEDLIRARAEWIADNY